MGAFDDLVPKKAGGAFDDLTPKVEQNSGILGDTVTDVKRGFEQLPGALTGLADIVNPLTYTNNRRYFDEGADWIGKKTGFQPGKWQEEAAKEYSPERQASDEAVNKAWEQGGIGNIAETYLTRPRSIAGIVGQALPATAGGGFIARGAMKGIAALSGADMLALRTAAAAGDKAALTAINRMATTAGGIGEGAITAGMNMDQVSRDVDPSRAALTSATSGVLTGTIGKYSGRLANKLGLPDLETVMAGGGTGVGGMPWYKRIPSSVVQESLLQEFPQSAQEQIMQNIAEKKPWDEGVARASIEGALAGAAMGGGVAMLPQQKPNENATNTPPTNPLLAQATQDISPQPGSTSQLDQTPTSFDAPKTLPPSGPLSGAVGIGRMSGAIPPEPVLRERDFVPPPSGSYGQLAEFENLLNGERADKQSRVSDLLSGQAMQAASEAESQQARVEAAQAQQSAQERYNLLQQVAETLPGDRNLKRAFGRALKEAGYSNLDFTPEETASIDNFNQINRSAGIAANIGPDIEPSTPNELDASQFIKEKGAKPEPKRHASNLKNRIYELELQIEQYGMTPERESEIVGLIDQLDAQVAAKKKGIAAPTQTYGAQPTRTTPLLQTATNLGLPDVAQTDKTVKTETKREKEKPAPAIEQPTLPPESSANPAVTPQQAQKGPGLSTPTKSYAKKTAMSVASMMTRNGSPTEAYPHPSGDGTYALRVPGSGSDATPKETAPNSQAIPDRSTPQDAVGVKPNASATLTSSTEVERQKPSAPAAPEGWNDAVATAQKEWARYDRGQRSMLSHQSGFGNAVFGKRKQTLSTMEWNELPPNAQRAIAKIFLVPTTQKASPAQAQQTRSNVAPIMRRNDLVGAIMRVTGGNGIASSMSDTLIGEKANRVGNLRGLFTNRGQQDMGDIAMLLREEEGFDVKDGPHLEELIREAASGNVAKSMAAQEEEKAINAEKEHRQNVRDEAARLGIKSAFKKFDVLEREVLARQAEEAQAAQSEAEAERAAIQAESSVKQIDDDQVNELLQLAVEDGRMIGNEWITNEEILAGFDATTAIGEREDEAGASRTGEGAASETAENSQEGSGQARAEVAPALALEGQTLTEVNAQEKKRQADEAAAQRDAAPKGPNVTADQVDLFNTQGGLFNSNRDSQEKKAQKPEQPTAQQPAKPTPAETTEGNEKLKAKRELIADMIETKRSNREKVPAAWETQLAGIDAQLRGEIDASAIYSLVVDGHPMFDGPPILRNLIPIKVTNSAEAERKLFAAQTLEAKLLGERSKAKHALSIAKTANQKNIAKKALQELDNSGITDDALETLRNVTLPELLRLSKAADERFGTTPAETPKAETPEATKGDNSIRHNVSDAWYYSALERHIDSLNTKSAPAQGWKDQIKGAISKGLVKAAEVEAVGINDWLDLQQGRVSKDQVQQFLDQNGVKVEEVTLDDVSEEEIEAFMDDEAGEGFTREEAIEYLRQDQEKEGLTKFSDYQLPGGENYKELLLTLPELSKANGNNAFSAQDKEELNKLGEGVDSGDISYDNNPDAFSRYKYLIEKSAKRFVVSSSSFLSSHFDQPNILAHVRFNERTDADGKKVLFIEEIQSDAAQGKRKGSVTWEAPFIGKTEAWTALSLKRIIRYAAENGFDKVAWANGEQQADRYDLSKQVDSINYRVDGEDTFEVSAIKDGESVITEHGQTAEQLEGLLGKEIAKKIVAGEGAAQRGGGNVKQLSGIDLKVGGEGMKGYYDRIVPSVANDVLKKIGGGRVGEVLLDTSSEAEDLAVPRDQRIAEEPTKQQGFDITPKMRESVMSGQALFNRTKNEKLTPSDKAIYGMAAEGKSAKDILKFIAASSRNPFYRQLARVLLKTGIAPKITVGDGKGFTFNAGNDKKYAASYDPKTDTVSLFRPASSERHVLHELVHAATIKALSKKGMAAVQMRALFNHVKATGKMNGMYGMENVDEFVAEAFSNPKFQELLKQIAAPEGSARKTVWDRFISVIRGILGLKPISHDALSRALSLGLGVMHENMKLSEGKNLTTKGNVGAGSIGGGISSVLFYDGNENAIVWDDGDYRISVNMPGRSTSSVLWHKESVKGKDYWAKRGHLSTFESEKFGKKWLRVQEVAIEGEHRGSGLGLKLYQFLLDQSGADIAGILSHSASITNKKQVPAIHRKLGAKLSDGGDFYMITKPEDHVGAGSATINVDGVERPRLNSNGKPIAQTDEGIRNFWKWFAGSKATDDQGRPLVVYHGTNADFSEFKVTRGGEFGPAVYLTDNPREAGEYGDAIKGVSFAAPSAHIMPSFVRLENPYTKGVDAFWKEFGGGTDADGIELAKTAGYDGVIAQRKDRYYDNDAREFVDRGTMLTHYIAFSPNQIKSSAGNNGQFSPDNNDIRYNVIGDSGRAYDQAHRDFFKNVGRDINPESRLQKSLNYLRNDFWKKMAVGIVDQFRGLRDLGDNGTAYMLARLSKGTAGAFDTLLHHGKLTLRDGVYDGDTSGGFVERLGVPLHGELDDVLWWIAANRAGNLAPLGKENLFSPSDIAAGKSLANGTTAFDYTIQTGPARGTVTRNRSMIYADAHRVFNEFQKNTLDMAEQSGLIDGNSRKTWESEFYVPFYRVSEEDGEFVGAKISGSLVRKRAFQKLKGGTDKLNSDLLSNTLQNWAHLITASAQNRAARAALAAAENVGVAQRVAPDMASYSASNGTMLPPGTKKTVWFQENGKKVEYLVTDPFVMTAITSLEYAGMRNGVMDAMTKFKHALTIGVTASPAFKVRNLIRDSLQAIGTSDLGYNPIKNVTEGYKQTRRDSQEYVSALASGGLIRFGTMLEGSESSRVRQLIKAGVKDSTILNSDNKWQAFYDKVIDPAVSAYNELGNRSEEINRAALYNQLIKQGKSHAEAALLARDLMDFSMQGSFNTIRFLSQVVPFFNARLQGMYKLGRAARDDPKKMAVVTGALALASIALMAGYHDDDDWKRREDWDRDNYWWFKLGGIEYRIPKPFELGAVATLAERSVEYLTNDEMTGERFRNVIGKIAENNLSMNPVPQMVKPIIDLYANKDSFTGRPIETMGMQRLDSDMRFNSNTSMLARALSTATLGALSPVQYDHLVRAYFGWIGATAVSSADMAARVFMNEPTKPAMDYWKVATQGMMKEQGSGSSRYLTLLYDQASELEQAYGTYRQLLKDGKLEDANDYYESNADKLKRYKFVNSVKSMETKLNASIRSIERSDASAEEKKARIERVQAMKERVAKRVAPGLQ